MISGDQVRYIVLLAMASLIGYGAAALFALLRRPQGSRRAWFATTGLELTAWVLVAIPGAFFGGLFVWFPIYWAAEHLNLLPATRDARFQSFAVIYVLLFIGALIVGFREHLSAKR